MPYTLARPGTVVVVVCHAHLAGAAVYRHWRSKGLAEVAVGPVPRARVVIFPQEPWVSDEYSGQSEDTQPEKYKEDNFLDHIVQQIHVNEEGGHNDHSVGHNYAGPIRPDHDVSNRLSLCSPFSENTNFALNAMAQEGPIPFIVFRRVG